MSIRGDPKSLAGRPRDRAALLGQVLTPIDIARHMVQVVMRLRPERAVSILDPAVGPATFPMALIDTGLLRNTDCLTAYDIDEQMVQCTHSRLTPAPCTCEVICGDYLELDCRDAYDIVIMNPPYVRQEWIDKKAHYRDIFAKRYGLAIPGTSNLYVYFLAKALVELRSGGRLACIVYDSWQFTRFGKWLALLLDANCDQVEIVPAGAPPFLGRLIDATLIFARRSSGRAVLAPVATPEDGLDGSYSHLSGIEGLRSIDGLFHTRRGLRLKQADFFMCHHGCVESLGATPFVKKVGLIKGYSVPDNHREAALLDSPSSQNNLVVNELVRRIEKAKHNPDANVSVLTWFRERPSVWYIHRDPPFAPILFNYYLRGRPRHIFNPSRAYADNFYGLKAKVETNPLILLAIMNSTCVCVDILSRSRRQGSGLAKIQLYEYRRVLVPDWTAFGKSSLDELRLEGEQLRCNPDTAEESILRIDQIIFRELQDHRLEPRCLRQAHIQCDAREACR